MVCFDEFGPLELRPVSGRSWRPSRRPERQRATYHRLGAYQYLAFMDLRSGVVDGIFRKRKTRWEVLESLRLMRSLYPEGTLYVVMDNLRTHKTREVREWCAAHGVERVFTPTYSSWLNLIEPYFRSLRRVAIENSDYQTKEELETATLAGVGFLNEISTPYHWKKRAIA